MPPTKLTLILGSNIKEKNCLYHSEYFKCKSIKACIYLFCIPFIIIFGKYKALKVIPSAL